MFISLQRVIFENIHLERVFQHFTCEEIKFIELAEVICVHTCGIFNDSS